ncbi:type I restriction endonuclease [Nesterenkonia lutea]|uniref:Type I restriction enzyme R protein N-terminal domain-containing protein n=1 Tax=Nesterenkonia lutea TaxID=272919 RepID=A0ABR9JB84_9MICC|nr:type I restriction endonuclease [Nesterenkonia lutea]MBE1523190.1 hypothetical protein [Nesterenkonia lutea]
MSDIEGKLSIIARKLQQSRALIETEEATKTTLIMPFIQSVLGFDVFDVHEVIPEFVADVGLKKGEKVDFAIIKDEEIAILIECKKLNEPLTLENASQLYRYFHVTTARIAVLTNGVEYRFYTDLDEPNKMDQRPFLELNLDDIDTANLAELDKLSKPNFDLDSVLNAAEELKYVSAARRFFANEAKTLSWDLASLVLGQIYSGRLTQRVREDLTPLVEKGFAHFLNDQANNRLKAALGASGGTSDVREATQDEPTAAEEPLDDSGIETTAEEIQGHMIIRAILSQELDPERVVLRDNKTYCSIILDDNNRKPIARLRFNNAAKLRIGTFDADKSEDLHEIEKLSDLYRHSSTFLATAQNYA